MIKGIRFAFELQKYRSDFYYYCDMVPESRNSPLLDNGSLGTFPQQQIGLWENQTIVTKLTHVSAATNRHAVMEGLLQVMTYIRFAPKL
jgi:hypothetical protein